MSIKTLHENILALAKDIAKLEYRIERLEASSFQQMVGEDLGPSLQGEQQALKKSFEEILTLATTGFGFDAFESNVNNGELVEAPRKSAEVVG